MSKILKISLVYFLLVLVMTGGAKALPLEPTPVCKSYWWFDNTTRTCAATKQFCGRFQYAGLKYFTSKNACLLAVNALQPTPTLACKTLYWFDNTNRTCATTKQFCGTFMYQGLRTFSGKNECLTVLKNKPTVKPLPTTGSVGQCGWCGTSCETILRGKVCPMISAPEGKSCVKFGSNNRCIAVLTSLNAKEGEACGGIAGKKCETGLVCQMLRLVERTNDTNVAVGGVDNFGNKLDYPDQTGVCVRPNVLPVMLGDANNDSKVDMADFDIWKNEFLGKFKTKKSDWSDTKGTIDMADFDIWKKAFLNPVVTVVLPTATLLPTVTLVPTCEPRPSCLDEVPSCNLPDKDTYCPRATSTMTVAPTLTLAPTSTMAPLPTN